METGTARPLNGAVSEVKLSTFEKYLLITYYLSGALLLGSFVALQNDISDFMFLAGSIPPLAPCFHCGFTFHSAQPLGLHR